MKPLRIGLTGGIGSSKTLTARIFEHMGVKVYYSDQRAKALYEKPEIQCRLQDLFGINIVSNGKVDTKKLADIVFNDTYELQKINNLVHPLIKDDFLLWQKSIQDDYVIMESAIIFETGWQDMFDKIICTYVPENLVMQRLLLRDKTDINRIQRRLANQMNPKDKCAKSDFVIINDNKQLVIPQVLETDKAIRQLIS